MHANARGKKYWVWDLHKGDQTWESFTGKNNVLNSDGIYSCLATQTCYNHKGQFLLMASGIQSFHNVILRNKTKPLPDDVHLGRLLFVLEFELIQFSHCLEIYKEHEKKKQVSFNNKRKDVY